MYPIGLRSPGCHAQGLQLHSLMELIAQFLHVSVVGIARFYVWIFLLFLERCDLNRYPGVTLHLLPYHLVLQGIVMVYGVHDIVGARVLRSHSGARHSHCDLFAGKEWHVLLHDGLYLLVQRNSLLFNP
jgi:hypothetical protein